MMATLSQLDVRVYRKDGSELQASDLARLMCPSCNGLLKEPVQVTACGDRFCHSCVSQLMSNGKGPFTCPIDNTQFEAHEVRKDRGCLKELQSLEIECTTRPKSCGWRGPLTKLEAHLAECPTVEVECPLCCGIPVLRSQLSAHVSSECANRPTQCQHCHASVPIESLQSHYQSCEEAPTNCNYCNKHLETRKKFESHLENECTEYNITCPLNSAVDCKFEAKRVKMTEHVQGHAIQLAELLTSVMTKVDSLTEKVESLTQARQEDQKKIENLSHRLERVEREKEEGQKKIVVLEKQVKGIRTFSDTGFDLMRGGFTERDCGSTQRSAGLEPTAQPHYSHTRHNFSHSFKSLSANAERGTEAVVSVMQQEMESHQTQLFKISENLQSVQASLTQHAVIIDEVRLRQDVLDVKTTNGSFTWKIPDIRRRYRDALDGRTISLYSPPFYTSPHGYRMCIRAYLNGDGIGKGTHVSVFFVLMRSEHDSLLAYPFKQSVRFTLVNQAHPSASITEAFIPDMDSASFKRPEKDMNVASGFPKFARQSVLSDENFTKDNVIFIKCQVDLTGLPLQ